MIWGQGLPCNKNCFKLVSFHFNASLPLGIEVLEVVLKCISFYQVSWLWFPLYFWNGSCVVFSSAVQTENMSHGVMSGECGRHGRTTLPWFVNSYQTRMQWHAGISIHMSSCFWWIASHRERSSWAYHSLVIVTATGINSLCIFLLSKNVSSITFL
jgi:hypothetical protein